MAHWERSITIEATPARVWTVMSDVARWPEWTASIRSVEEVTPPGLGDGGTAVVDAVGAPRSKYTVTRWEPGHGFDWETKVRGVRTIGGHWVEPAGEGRSRVTLAIDVKGLAGTLFRPLLSRTMNRNLGMEAEGLKRRSEEAA